MKPNPISNLHGSLTGHCISKAFWEMAKAKSKLLKITSATSAIPLHQAGTAKGKGRASEIDEIFAGGAFQNAVAPTYASGSTRAMKETSKTIEQPVMKLKKNKHKLAANSEATDSLNATALKTASSGSTKVPLTIVDTSSQPPFIAGRNEPSRKKRKHEFDQAGRESVDEDFRDSRGTGNRE